MKPKNIDIEQFKTIDELYTFLESNAYQLERNWDLTDIFVKYRNQTTDETEKQKAQWEVEFFIFEFKGSKIFSLSYSTGKNIGEVKKYPDLDEFQQTAFKYLKQRSADTKNPLLLARYNHLLWKAPKGIKHKDFALAAIDNYIKSIHEFYKFFEADANNENLFRVGQIFETLVGLCDEVKEKLPELKSLTKYLLFKAKHLEFYSRHGIVDDMLEYSNIFKKDDFKNVLSIYQKEINRDRKKTDDFLLVNYHLPSAIKVAIKTGADVRKWHNESGLAYLRIGNAETEQDRNWLKLDAYAKAIHAFTLAANAAKKKAVEKLYAELKPKVILPTFRSEFSEDDQKVFREFQDNLKKFTGEILMNEPNEVFKTIASGYFFPKYGDVLKASKGSHPGFTEFSTTIYFDKNKNITKTKKKEEDERKLYQTYQQQISFKVLPYLHYIIVTGIKSGQITFESFIRYLAEKTWIGKPHFKIDLGGEQEEINWIALISPSVYEYFIQVEAWDSSKYYRPSFVLCVDSLTLKMEGLFRNFCERLDIPVSVGRNKSMQEEYIHNLLVHPTIKKYFNEDDLLFFNFLFAGESGMNLRNNIAHCFYNIDDYSSDKMLLLLAALLRIGKYDIKKK